MIMTTVDAPEYQVWASVMPVKYVFTPALPPRRPVPVVDCPQWTVADADENKARGWTND